MMAELWAYLLYHIQKILKKATYLAHLIDQYQNQNLIVSKMETSDYNILASALLQPK